MNLLLGGAVVYGALVGGLYLLQDTMIFPRAAARKAKYPLPAGAERLRLRTNDGDEIVGNLVRASRPSRGLVIGFSGNAWNADDCTTFIAHRFPDVDIAVFHYRGYAPSTGKPSEKAFFADAELIFDTLVKGLKPERVYTFGFSIGSGVAAHLSRHRPIDGQVLVTPFDSIAAIALARYKVIPVKQLLKHPFDSVRALRGHKVPTAIIMASEDTVVPRMHTERLMAVLENLVFDETVPGTHGGIYDLDVIEDVLRRALDAIEAAADDNEPARDDTRQAAAHPAVPRRPDEGTAATHAP